MQHCHCRSLDSSQHDGQMSRESEHYVYETEGMLALAVGSGQVIQALKEDVTAISGPRDQHDSERAATRHRTGRGSVNWVGGGCR